MAKKDPIDDYLTAKTKQGHAQNDTKMQLWGQWKQNPNPTTLEPLLHAFKPTFNTQVRTIKAPNTNETALRADLMTQAIKAFQNYDPNRGASLTTHVTNSLKKSQRFNTRVQNLAYIPEDKTKYIGSIDAARDELRDELNRDPTHAEIGARVGLTGKRVKEIQGLRRADIRGSSFQSDPVGHVSSRDQEVISLLRHELKPGDEQTVYDYLYGKNGKQKVESTGAIARLMGKNESQISRIKNKIGALYKQYV